MKITNQALFNIVETEEYKEHHRKAIEKNRSEDTDRAEPTYNANLHFLTELKFRKLVLSESCIKDINENYNLPKDLNHETYRKIASALPNRTDAILVHMGKLIRYHKTEEKLTIFCDDYNYVTDQIDQTFVHSNLKTGDLVIGQENGRNDEITDDVKDMASKLLHLFLLIATYLEFTQIKTEVLNANSSVGTKKTGKFTNETNKQYLIVRGNWNTRKIIVGNFNVKGHWRLQPYGVGRSQYKYIYIEAFEKGVIRKHAQKELVD